LAEWQIEIGDLAGLELILRGKDSSLTESQRTVLEIRSLLRQGKATDALQRCNSIVDSGAGEGNELNVLQLESLLLLRMLADELQDTSLQKSTHNEWSDDSEAVLLWRESVWKDAAVRVIQRYQLIETVGAQAATLVEHVESLRVAGQLDEAFRELQRALRLLPPQASVQSKAAVHLRMGEILIAQQKWDQACPLLRRANTLFVEAERPTPASTADLLYVFCVGQQWRVQPEDESLRNSYFRGLVEHRDRWHDETSYDQATEWLVQFTQQIDPLYAADVLVQHAAESETLVEQQQRLNHLGEQLEKTRNTIGTTQCHKTWSDLVAEFQTICEINGVTSGELSDQSARILLLQASLTTDAATVWEFWKQLHHRLPDIRLVLVDPDAAIQNRWNHLMLIATARTSTDATTLEHRQKKYLSGTTDSPLTAARKLARFLRASGLIQSGDSLIAATIEQLLLGHVSETSSATDLSEMLSLATLTNRVTGSRAIRAQLLDRMLALNLTSQQTTDIAMVLMELEEQQTEQGKKNLAGFWKRVRSESQEGSDLWLESCLQLARIQAQHGKQAEAARQLRVTSVIYPEWGSVGRRQRVDTVLREWQQPTNNE